MARYQLAVFDVDGTLHDSFLSVARSYQYALKEITGILHGDLGVFRPCVGPPISDSFALFGVRGEDAVRGIGLYQDFYRKEAYKDVRLYEGAVEMLKALRDAGVHVGVASSKHEDVLRFLFSRDGTADLFGYVAGVQDEDACESKSSLIGRNLSHFGLRPEQAVMVGDRIYDAAGARDAGVEFIAAGYGFGSPEEFKGYPMAFYAHSAAGVRRFILGEAE